MNKKYVSVGGQYSLLLTILLFCLFFIEGYLFSWPIASITILPLLFIPFVIGQSYYKIKGNNLIKYSSGILSSTIHIPQLQKIKIGKDDNSLILFYDAVINMKLSIKDRDSFISELLRINPSIILDSPH